MMLTETQSRSVSLSSINYPWTMAMLGCSCYSLNQIFCFILATHIATAMPNNLHSSRLLLESSVVMKKVSFQNCIQPLLASKPFLFLENQNRHYREMAKECQVE